MNSDEIRPKPASGFPSRHGRRRKDREDHRPPADRNPDKLAIIRLGG